MMRHLNNLHTVTQICQDTPTNNYTTNYEPKVVKTVTLGLQIDQFVAHKKLQSRAIPVIANKKAKVNARLPKINSKVILGNPAPQNYWNFVNEELAQKSCSIVIQTPEPDHQPSLIQPAPQNNTGSLYSAQETPLSSQSQSPTALRDTRIHTADNEYKTFDSGKTMQ